MRDYGTGTWEGGDAECDHKAPATGGPNPERYTPRGGEMFRAANDKLYQDACGKCGARRVDQQLGLEPTPDQYVTNMVALFREVRRVLRRDGTCWLNLGDSYMARQFGWNTSNDRAWAAYHREAGDEREKAERTGHPMEASNAMAEATGLKPKDLVGIPWRVAFALQADGWYLRSDIIWSKPNPMPESVTDRPTKAHEYLFLLTRSPRYFYDADAIREEFAPKTLTHRGGGRAAGKVGNQDANGKVASGNFGEWDKPRTAYAPPKPQEETLDGSEGETPRGADGRRQTRVAGADGSIQHRDGERWPNGARNARSVWEIATQPYPEAHFATFPEELARRCIAAGTSERGCCPECGAPWEREVERELEATRGNHHPDTRRDPYDAASKPNGVDDYKTVYGRYKVETIGWRPGCPHRNAALRAADPLTPAPCVVLDPFMGSGTVAHVARKLGRRTIGIELNPDYCELAARRLQQQSLLA